MLQDSPYRGTGRTTRQMMAAPHGAVFVWCVSDIYYPKALARHIGREDLDIRPVGSLDRQELWQGVEIVDIVLDHACILTGNQNYVYCYAQAFCGRKFPKA